MGVSGKMAAAFVAACLFNFAAGVGLAAWVGRDAVASVRNTEIVRADVPLRAAAAALDAGKRADEARAALAAAGVSSVADYDALQRDAKSAADDEAAKRAAFVSAVSAWADGK